MHFDIQISNQMSISVGRDLNRCDGTSALHFVPRCLQSATSSRKKIRFGPENFVNSTLFVTGDNTLELISNWTANFYFLLI